MTPGNKPMDKWKNIPWHKIERNVFKLQQRIYQAAVKDDRKAVHRLQKLLMKSQSGRLLAVRRVSSWPVGNSASEPSGDIAGKVAPLAKACSVTPDGLMV